MYTYIVIRTQIYLTERLARTLGRMARVSGRTRSQLIREALEKAYLPPTKDEILATLQRTHGAWKGRRYTGAQFVERLRSGGRIADLLKRRGT